MLQWYAAYFWLTDKSVARDSAVFQNAERYKMRFEELCKNGGRIPKADGSIIDLDTSRSEANQAKSSSREGTLAQNNDHRFQTTPLQFLSGSASTRAAGAKFGNKADGSI